MKKSIIYTNEDNEDFEVESYKCGATQKPHLHLHIKSGNNHLYFMSKCEVHDFCEILMNEADDAFKDTK